VKLEPRIEKKIERIPESGCWIWMACLFATGYGAMNFRGKAVKAHRHIYEVTVGPIPPGMDLCHHCDVRECVNPDHMFVGTRQDNMDDAKAKGRKLGSPKKAICPRGHVRSGDNLYEWRGKFSCRICRRRWK
jgi:HNH endonuclease